MNVRPRTCAPPPFTPAELAQQFELRLQRFRDQMITVAVANYGYGHVAQAVTQTGAISTATLDRACGDVDLAAKKAA